MKLTPEQKAWFEYGRSRGWLKAHRSKKYFADVPDMGLSFWHMQRNMCGLNALIRDTWRKRAACRAWVPLIHRDCHNCAYKNIKAVPVVCNPCINEGFAVNWEPRKEGE